MRGKFLVLLFGVLLLCACGGGGGSSSSSTTTSSTSGEATRADFYLPYLASIDFVDCSDPSNPVEVVPGTIQAVKAFLMTGNINMETGDYEDLHYSYLLYIQDGKLYRLDLRKSDAIPSPQQIEGINDACDFVDVVRDFWHGHNFVFVRTKGADGTCNTTGSVYLYSAYDNLTEVLSGKVFEVELPDKGYNVGKALFCDENDNTKGYICDIPGMSGCKDMSFSSCNVTVAVHVYRTAKKGFEHYYCIGGDIYKWEDGSLNKLTDNGTCSGWITIAADDNYVYGTDGSAIYRYSEDAGLAQLCSSRTRLLSGLSQIVSIYPLKNHVVFVQSTSGIHSLYKVSKNGGTPSQIDTGLLLVTGFPKEYYGKIFYNKMSNATLGGTPEFYACIYDDNNNSTNCIENAYWAGYSQKPSGRYLDLKGFLLVENGVLYFTDTSGNKIRRLGEVGSPLEQQVSFYGIGSCLIGVSANLLQSNATDVIFVNLDKENSLVKVTDTQDRSEVPIY